MEPPPTGVKWLRNRPKGAAVRTERTEKEADMARMDLKLRREAPGMSVFWMILIVGIGVFVLVAIVLMSANGTAQVEHEDQEIVAGEGDEPPGTASFGDDEVAEEGPQEPGELPGEAGELDESVPPTGQADDSRDAGTVGAVDADPGEATIGADAEIVDEEADAEEPEPPEDDTGELTPSGPESRDDEVILEDGEEIVE